MNEHPLICTGESVKLTESIVRLLRHAIPLGLWNEDDAAAALNMKPKSITDIIRGKSWKHLLSDSSAVQFHWACGIRKKVDNGN